MWRDWEKKTLGELAHINMGQSPDSNSVSEDNRKGMPFLQGNAEFGIKFPTPYLYCTQPKKKCLEGDFLISVRAPVGALNVANQNYCIGRGLAALTVPSQQSGYLWHALNNFAPELAAVSQGSTFDAINSNNLAELEFYIPKDENEQKAIAEVLDTVDEAIAATQTMLEKQDKIKDGLLQDLLTYGVDASGKLRKKHQPLNATLSDVVSLVNHKIAVGKDPNLPYVGLEHIDKKNLHLSRFGHAFDSVSTNNVFAPDDILFGKLRPNLRKCALAESHGYCSTDILVLRANADVNPQFALYVCSSEPVFYEAIKSTEGTKMPRTSWATIKQVPVFLPDRTEQDRIVSVVSAHIEEIRNTTNELIKLKNLKAGLMQDLLTGKKRVPSAWKEAA